MKQLVARVVWSAIIAAVCAVTAVGVAMVYGETERVLVLALMGGGITFAILSTRP